MRFPEFTDEWKQTTLGEIVDVLNSKRKPITSTERIKGTYPYYGASGVIDYVNDFIFEEQLLLVGEDGAKWGRYERTAFIVSGKFWVNNHAHVLRVRNVSIDRFVEAYLVLKNIQTYVTGDAPPKLTLDNLKALPISLPSLPEQQKIATFLSLLDERIEAQRQIIKERKAEKKALLHQLFSQSIRFPGFSEEWKQTTLGEICQVVGGGTPSTGIDKYWGGNIPWFTPSEIQKKYIGDSERKITEEGLSNSGARLLPKGAILLTTRATVGECSISTNPCCTNQGFQSLIINPNTSTTEFIYQKVQTLKNEFLIRANGSTFKEITAQEIRGIHMFIPTLEEQSKIADFLSLLDTQIEVEEELLQKYEEQKKYLLRMMFV